MVLDARPVDPRDVTIEVDDPTFRVYFWRTLPGSACREFEVTGADVVEVIRWAEDNRRRDETYVLSLLTSLRGPDGREVVLTRIRGADPSRS